MCFGNGGNRLTVNFYGGQDNRLAKLDTEKFEDVKKAPGPDTTAGWRNIGLGIDAAVGPTYVLHVNDPRDKIDFTVKFRILDMSADEWIVIEWEPIPQEK